MWPGLTWAEATLGCYSISEGPSPCELGQRRTRQLCLESGYLCPYLAVLRNLGQLTASLWATVLGSSRETEPIGVCVCVCTCIKRFIIRNWQAGKSRDLRGKVQGRGSGELMVQFQPESEGWVTRTASRLETQGQLTFQFDCEGRKKPMSQFDGSLAGGIPSNPHSRFMKSRGGWTASRLRVCENHVTSRSLHTEVLGEAVTAVSGLSALPAVAVLPGATNGLATLCFAWPRLSGPRMGGE